MKPHTIFNRILTITLASAALLTTSCKKDSDKEPEKAGTKLVKVEESATSYATFDYNAAGQVVKMTSHESFGGQSFDITYEGNRPSVIKSGEGAVKFKYQDNKLDVAELFADHAQTQASGQIKLNYLNGTVDNMVIFHLLEDSEEPTPIAKSAYEYFANGDVKKEFDYIWNPLNGQFKLSGTTVYEYDDKNNPLVALGDAYKISFKAVSKHNPVKETEFDEDGAMVQTITYTYTYNNNAYPATAQKKITTAGQANPVVSNIKYSYQ